MFHNIPIHPVIRGFSRGRVTVIVLSVIAGLSGLASADIDAAANYSAKHSEIALLVWENGRLRFDRQKREGLPVNAFSITKSLAALGALQAVGRGILDLDEPVSRTIPSWSKDTKKSRITARQLLDQTSGISTGYESLYSRRLQDKASTALKLPTVTGPGTAFSYGPSHYEILEVLLSKKSRRPSHSWLSPRRTGIKPDQFRHDARGRPFYSAGARLSPHQLLESGKLVIQNGRSGLFEAIPSHLIKEAMIGSDANPMYGLGFWLNANARKPSVIDRDIEQAISSGLSRDQWGRSCLSKRAPADLVAMAGSRGQRVYIVPSKNQVIVRLGNADSFRDPQFLRLFYE